MNKKMLSRVLALILALSAALSFAACGKTAQEEAAPEPEYVYKSEYSPLATEANGTLSVKVYTKDGAYASCDEKVGREIPETADVENMTEDDLTKFDKYATNIYFIGNDGKAEKLPNYAPMPGRENEGEYTDFYSSPGLENITVDGDGNLVTVEYIYTGWYDGPEGKTYADEDYYDYYKSSQEVFLRTLDSTGAELRCVPMELGADQYLRSSVVTDDEGNLVCITDKQLLAFNADGREAYSIDCGGYVASVTKLSDGRIYVTLWGDNGLTLAPVDSETKTLGKGVSLPNDAYFTYAGGGDYDLYYTSGLNFYGYDIETQTAEAIFNWINCNVNTDGLSGLRIGEDGTVTGFAGEADYVSETYSNERVTVSKVPYDPQAAQNTLTLACLSLDYNVQNAVIRFNRSSDGARIEIKDYSEYNTGDDSEAGAQKLLTEIMAGDMPDILAVSGLPYRRIASKGLLEDLYPYIDSDAELKREDFFPNILSAYEVNGGLYSVCPSFYVATVMGAVSVVGDRSSWTYDDFNEALSKMPEGCEPFEPGSSKANILRACLSLDMPSYVNWSTGECSFDSEQFVKLLEFAGQFRDEYPDDAEEDSMQDRIQSGRQMLLATSIYSMDDVLYDCSYFGGQDVCYIGFPTLSDNGSAISTESGFAISSSCGDKAKAWEFLRGFLTEKYQREYVWSIPTNLAAYNYKLAEMMKTRYVIDENGQFVLDENGDKVKEPLYTMSVDNGPVVNVYAMTQEQADEITSVIKAASKSFDYDESIISIVQEEAAAYFAGQKSAQEVAKLVQGKANIYVNEQS